LRSRNPRRKDREGQLYILDCPEWNCLIFGPQLLATIGWLKSVGHCSYSIIEAWLEDVLQVPVSRGYLTKLCTSTISGSLSDTNVEPTNNHSEQQIRHCVIDRKPSKERGAKPVNVITKECGQPSQPARNKTSISSHSLRDSIAAQLDGLPTPSLILA